MLRRTILLTCLLLLTWPLTAQAAPSLVIRDTRLSLADPVDQGRTAQGEFMVENRGDAPLQIKNVTPG